MHRKSGNQRHRPAIWQRCRTLRTLKQIHAVIVISGQFYYHLSSIRELLFSAAISIPNSLHYACKVFDRIPLSTRDLFMYNTMIRASSHGPTPSDAIRFYVTMTNPDTQIAPDKHTFPFLLKSCSRLSRVATGHQFHGRIVKAGLEGDGFVRNALINFNANCGELANVSKLFDESAKEDAVAWSAVIAGYARRGEIDVARTIFDEASCKDLVSWNVMITAYAKMGQMTSARELFDKLPNRDVVSWNAMISGYAKCGLYDKAMDFFEDMKVVDIRPDKVTLLSLLSACANSGALEAGERLHRFILEMCLDEGDLSLFHGNALIDMYAKCGCIIRALDIFKGMRYRDLTTWNSIINGLAFHGHAEEGLWIFKEMLNKRVRPDEITFVGVLAACSHGGMVDLGRRYFSLMREEYGIQPNIKHYGCMVDLLGRAGLLNEAFEFIKGMTNPKPNPIVWRALLGACRLHGNAKLGKHANERLLQLGHDASGDYILLSNIYASVGEWRGAEDMRKMMEGKGVPKEAGSSKIDAENERHSDHQMY